MLGSQFLAHFFFQNVESPDGCILHLFYESGLTGQKTFFIESYIVTKTSEREKRNF